MKPKLVTDALPVAMAALVSLFAGCVARPTWHGDEGTAYDVLNRSTIALLDIDHSALNGPVGAAMHDACALFVFPGAQAGVASSAATRGAGILLARERNDGPWAGPAFYSLRVHGDGRSDHADVRGWVIAVGCDALPRLLADPRARDGGDAALDDVPGNAIAGWTLSARKLRPMSLEDVTLRALPAISMAYYQAPAPPRAILVERSVRNDASAEILSAIETVTR